MPESPPPTHPPTTVYLFSRLPCSPAANPFLKAVAVGNKEPARPLLPRLRDPGARRTAEGERELGPESRFAAVRAERPAPPCSPPAGLGTRCLGSRASPPRIAASRLSPGDACPSTPGDRRCRSLDFSAGLREDPALLRGVLKFYGKKLGCLIGFVFISLHF